MVYKNIAKTIVALGSMVFFMSCENEIPSEVPPTINNNNFKREVLNIPVVSTIVVVDTARTNFISRSLLGIYKEPNLGKVEASMVTQFVAEDYPLKRYSIDNEPLEVESTVTDVQIILPYDMSKDSDSDVFLYNDLLGNKDATIKIQVEKFDNFLEYLNADTTTRIYYSNGGHGGDLNHRLINLVGVSEIQEIDLKENLTENDTLFLSLDKGYFQGLLFSNKESDEVVSTHDNLTQLLKGLKISPMPSEDGFLLPFDIRQARLRIAYDNKIAVRNDTVIKDTLLFGFQDFENTGSRSVTYNIYEHDHAKVGESDNTFIQGTKGYEINVDISELANQAGNFESQNWLINEASLKIYVDDTKINEADRLEDLYIYTVDKDGKAEVVEDYLNSDFRNSVGGDIQYENTDTKEKPFFQFFITNHIKEALTEGTIKELRIKSRSSSKGSNNFLLDFRSYRANGVVLFNEEGVNNSLKPEFKIEYSRIE